MFNKTDDKMENFTIELKPINKLKINILELEVI